MTDRSDLPDPAVRGAHTPRPWKLDNPGYSSPVLGNGDQYHMITGGDGPERFTLTGFVPDADARLIVAAPDLDALLVEGLDLVSQLIDDADPMATTLYGWCGRVRATLARAHGEDR